MPYLAQQRLTGDSNVVMKHVRKPKFVDNALHLGEVSLQGSSKQKVTLRQRKKANYPIGTERAYEVNELEDGVRLTHRQVAGHEHLSSLVYMGSSIGTDAALYKPPLLYSIDTNTERISLGSVLTGSQGATLSVRNLKGRTLQEIGFNSNLVHIGYPIDVGFRTTDMALRLGRDVANSFTSVNIALPMSPTRSVADRRKHSTTFTAVDFNNANLITALRFIGRHDNHIIYFDRFGNVLYVPFNFSESGRFVDANSRVGPSQTNPVENAPSTIAVQGVSLSLNESAFAEVSDAERESGRAPSIQQEAQVVTDMTVKTNESARRVARNILKANNLLAGNKSSSGHPQSWDLRPGQIIEYEGVRRILTEVRHNLAKDATDLVFLTVDTGIEGVLQGIAEGAINTGSEPNTVEQISEKNLSLFGDIKIKVTPLVTITHHGASGTGFIIGKAMNRGTIGATSSQETVGGSKSTGVMIRGDD